jgi:hypothetical protein
MLEKGFNLSNWLKFLFCVSFCSLSLFTIFLSDILLLYPSKAYKAGDKVRFPILELLGCEKPEAEFEALDDEDDQNSKKGMLQTCTQHTITLPLKNKLLCYRFISCFTHSLRLLFISGCDIMTCLFCLCSLC